MLSVKPVNLRPSNDDVPSLSIKELLSELAEYNTSTVTTKDKKSLQDAVIGARKDGWKRSMKSNSALKTPPPSMDTASAAQTSVTSDECHVGKFSSGCNSSKKRSAYDASSSSKSSKKAKAKVSLPELALAKKSGTKALRMQREGPPSGGIRRRSTPTKGKRAVSRQKNVRSTQVQAAFGCRGYGSWISG